MVMRLTIMLYNHVKESGLASAFILSPSTLLNVQVMYLCHLLFVLPFRHFFLRFRYSLW